MRWSRRAVVIGGALALLSGCARWQQPAARDVPQLLQQATASPESVTLEIFFARVPWDDAEVNGPLWERIDEQSLPAELRQRMASNGLRAGLVGGQVPSRLAELMHLTDEPPPEREEPGIQQGVSLESEPAVRRRLLQLRSGRRGEILASGLIPSLPLLIREGGRLRGQTYEKAQGLFAVRAGALPDRQVKLSLTPEVQHGEAKQQWSGQDGIFQLEMARPKEIFAELEIEALLTPGQMLVVSCLPERPGSLGCHFFRDESARGKEQKVLIIRLVQTPLDALYEAEPSSPQP